MRVLSIDGGGIRGLIPAIVPGGDRGAHGPAIAGLFDLIAGTSATRARRAKVVSTLVLIGIARAAA